MTSEVYSSEYTDVEQEDDNDEYSLDESARESKRVFAPNDDIKNVQNSPFLPAAEVVVSIEDKAITKYEQLQKKIQVLKFDSPPKLDKRNSKVPQNTQEQVPISAAR